MHATPEVVQSARMKVDAAASQAVDVLLTIMLDPEQPARDRVRAARDLLDRSPDTAAVRQQSIDVRHGNIQPDPQIFAVIEAAKQRILARYPDEPEAIDDGRTIDAEIVPDRPAYYPEEFAEGGDVILLHRAEDDTEDWPSEDSTS